MRATPPPQLIDSPFDLASTTAIAPSPGKYEIMVELSSFSGEDYDRNAERIFCDEVNRVRDIMDEIEERLLGGEDFDDIVDEDEEAFEEEFY